MRRTALFKQYAQAGSVSVISKAVVMVCGVVILWTLTDILPKQEFGLFMIALSFVLLVSGVIGSIFQSVVLYHAARYHGEKPEDSCALADVSMFYGGVVSCTCTVLIVFCTPILSRFLGGTGVGDWLVPLSLMIPAHVTLLILSTWHRGQQDIVKAALYGEILPFIMRCAGLLLIWGTGLVGHELSLVLWVSVVFVCSSLGPLCLLFWRVPVKIRMDRRIFTAWDIRYGLKSALTQVINKPTRGFDVLLLGALASATIVADYAVALRLAQLLAVPKHAVAQLLIPRMGQFMRGGSIPDTVWHEYAAGRQVILTLTIVGCLFFALFGAFVLSLFGGYDTALPLLMILCAAPLTGAVFGTAGGFVSIAGHAGWTFIMGGVSSVVMLGGALVFIPLLLGVGAALAVLAGTCITMIGFAVVIWYLYGRSIIQWPATLAWILATAGVISTAVPSISVALSLTALIGSILIIVFCDRSLLRFWRYEGT